MNVTAQALTVDEFTRAYKVGRTKTYEEIESGRLATYSVGRNRYISGRAAEQWQRNLEAASAGTKPVEAP